MQTTKTRDLVLLSLFVAIIALLAFVPNLGYIPLGAIRLTILHIPVIIGSLMLGPKRGAILGGVFGLTSLIVNTLAPMATSFVFSPFYTLGDTRGNALSLVICFGPRILVGVFPYYIYRALSQRVKSRVGENVALCAAGFVGSMTNTLLVMHLIFAFFGSSYALVKGIDGQRALYTAIITVIGVNGTLEALVATILVTGIVNALRLAGVHSR